MGTTLPMGPRQREPTGTGVRGQPLESPHAALLPVSAGPTRGPSTARGAAAKAPGEGGGGGGEAGRAPGAAPRWRRRAHVVGLGHPRPRRAAPPPALSLAHPSPRRAPIGPGALHKQRPAPAGAPRAALIGGLGAGVGGASVQRAPPSAPRQMA